jgi:thiosulfate dehydrogenase [quinone] large subunit
MRRQGRMNVATQLPVAAGPVSSDDRVSTDEPFPASSGTTEVSPIRRNVGSLRFADWLYRSDNAAILWLVVRIWLGYQWLNAGYQKIWGAERSVFWFGSGAGVKGFVSAGVAGSAAGKSGASYGWWAAFLHNFVIPNSSWIAKLVSLTELLVGVALILGLLTGLAAGIGLVLNLIYMFSGSAGVNPMYATLGVLLVLAWRNSGWIGLDRFVLHNRLGPRHERGMHRRESVAHVAH